MANQPTTPPGPRTPPRNNHKGFLLGLIKGKQWLISHDYRGRHFPFFFADTTGLRGLKRLTLVTSLHGADYQQRNFQAPRKANSSGTYKYIYIYKYICCVYMKLSMLYGYIYIYVIHIIFDSRFVYILPCYHVSLNEIDGSSIKGEK